MAAVWSKKKRQTGNRMAKDNPESYKGKGFYSEPLGRPNEMDSTSQTNSQ